MFFLQFGHTGDDRVQLLYAARAAIPISSGINHDEAEMPPCLIRKMPIARNISRSIKRYKQKLGRLRVLNASA
jgi:hypothetical protein